MIMVNVEYSEMTDRNGSTENSNRNEPGTSRDSRSRVRFANAPPSPLTTQMVELLKNAQRSAKTHALASIVLPPAPCDVSPTSPASSTPSISPSSSSDRTDNRDPFGFYPEAKEMQSEEERLKSFDKWPLTFLTPEQLAKNGFYYLGRGDEVRCAFCQVEIMRWEEGDDPAKDHQRWAPQCPFLRRLAGESVPVTTPTDAGRDECGLRAPPAPGAAVRMPGPVHPRYASEAARLRSFKDWPRSMRQKPEELSEAGFFYTGHGDKTKCFYCDGGLKDWEDDDVPWEQHARWFNRCAYVQLVKGRDYVQKVLAEATTPPATTPSDEKEVPPPVAPVPVQPVLIQPQQPSEEKASVVDDNKLCKICFENERNVCFVPCGHVVACAKCALSTDKCPMCRRTFSNAVRLYYS